MKLKVYADREVEVLHNFVTGANKVDAHFSGVQVDRDLKIEKIAESQAFLMASTE